MYYTVEDARVPARYVVFTLRLDFKEFSNLLYDDVRHYYFCRLYRVEKFLLIVFLIVRLLLRGAYYVDVFFLFQQKSCVVSKY